LFLGGEASKITLAGEKELTERTDLEIEIRATWLALIGGRSGVHATKDVEEAELRLAIGAVQVGD